MALEVIRNNVALSVTCLILSPMSPLTRNPSSSDRDLKEGKRSVRDSLQSHDNNLGDGIKYDYDTSINTTECTHTLLLLGGTGKYKICLKNAVLVNTYSTLVLK